MSVTEIFLNPRCDQGGLRRISATLKSPIGELHELWFTLPPQWEPAVTTWADPFVVGFLFQAMHLGKTVRVHGAVSPSLLANLQLASQIWHSIYPDLYQPLDFVADQEREQPVAVDDDVGVTCFSGGVDSCYTVWRHHCQSIGRRSRRLAAGIIVQGFADLPLGEDAFFEQACENSRNVLSSIGLETIAMSCNARELPMPGRHSWRHAHGTALGACLSLFSGRFRFGLIANSIPYICAGMDYGSNPIYERLMSSRSFELADDGGEVRRLAKIRELIAWPEAQARLHVCNARSQHNLNCCRCEKCLRTMLAFRIYQKDTPACFHLPLTEARIRELKLRYSGHLFILRGLRNEAVAQGHGAEGWVKALEGTLRRGRRRVVRRQIRQWLLGFWRKSKSDGHADWDMPTAALGLD